MNKGFLEEFAYLDPVLSQYQHRQKLQKLVTTYIPQMYSNKETKEVAPVVHTTYNIIVSTGRTSSRGGNLYPSCNMQQVDPRVRNCFEPREGFLMGSSDYSAMELGTAAQRCINLFGSSVLGDIINEGIDAHEFLGAQIAYHTDDNFRASFDGVNADTYTIYKAFHALLDDESGMFEDFWKHYRKFAKPTGLGFPGGLGPDTFRQYAKDTYGVTVDLATAKNLRSIWLDTFPEFNQYFNWIKKQCIDRRNSGGTFVDEDGKSKKITKYAYTTPFGLYRAGCGYCSAANGAALQGFSAEGAKLAVYSTLRECYDFSKESTLYGNVFPLAFIHDETLYEIKEDDHIQERIDRIEQLMVDAMMVITPNVQARVETALMRRWDKFAEPVHDDQGNLTVWTP